MLESPAARSSPDLSGALHDLWTALPETPELRFFLANSEIGALVDEAAEDAASMSLSFGDFLSIDQMQLALSELQIFLPST